MSEIRAIPTIEELRRAATVAGREADCRLIVLFGSAARGSGSTPADVDVAVLSSDELDTVALTNRLIQDLGFQEIDIADLGHADPLLMMLVARDGVPLYEGRPGEFARFASLAARRYADTRKFRDMEQREIEEFVAERQSRS